MHWLKLSQRRFDTQNPAVDIESIVMQVASNSMTVEYAAQQLQGKPEACLVLQTVYPNVSSNHALVSLAYQIGCNQLGEPQVQNMQMDDALSQNNMENT